MDKDGKIIGAMDEVSRYLIITGFISAVILLGTHFPIVITSILVIGVGIRGLSEVWKLTRKNMDSKVVPNAEITKAT